MKLMVPERRSQVCRLSKPLGRFTKSGSDRRPRFGLARKFLSGARLGRRRVPQPRIDRTERFLTHGQPFTAQQARELMEGDAEIELHASKALLDRVSQPGLVRRPPCMQIAALPVDHLPQLVDDAVLACARSGRP